MRQIDFLVQDIKYNFQYVPDAAYLALMCIAAYLIVWTVHHIISMRKTKSYTYYSVFYMFSTVFFAIYMYILSILVYYSREPGSRNGVDMQLWSTWGMTLQEHAYFIENILLFIPFGMLFPIVFKKYLRWFTVPIGFMISVGIEYIQYVTARGFCQLDDVVTNTAGTIIGFIMFLLGYMIYRLVSAQCSKSTYDG